MTTSKPFKVLLWLHQGLLLGLQQAADRVQGQIKEEDPGDCPPLGRMVRDGSLERIHTCLFKECICCCKLTKKSYSDD